ncbi:MAG: DNA methyltransferase [Candidatus Hodarchaeales archaeon]
MPSLSLKDYQEDRQERGVYDKRNPLNDLTGKEWLFSTKTVIPKTFPVIWSKNLNSRNQSPLPSDLSRELVETFSKPGNTILDPFAGIGSTLIGGYFANKSYSPPRRKCIGIETNKTLIKQYNQLTKKLNIPSNDMIIGDPITVLSDIRANTVDFILSDIPIWDISGANENDSIAMSLDQYNQSPQETLYDWNSSICAVLSESTNKLKKSKYLVVSIPNQPFWGIGNEEVIPPINFALLGILSNNLQQSGLVLKAERIWFEINDTEPKNIYRTLNRRFLVFRKEFPSSASLKLFFPFFDEKIPIGNTNIIHKSFPPSFNHKLRREHGGMKPPELAELLIEKFSNTKAGELILDPFAGVGGTLLGASLTGRKAIGIDINDRWKTIYQQVSLNNGLEAQEFHVGDSQQLIDEVIQDNSIDLILTDVPYWAMDKLQKTRGRFSKAGEESRGKLHTPLHKFNQSSILTIDQWLELLKNVFSKCYPKLIDGKYLMVFIGNMYRTIPEVYDNKTRKVGKYLLLSSLLAKELLFLGYEFVNEIIWYAPDKALHVFGYPFTYIPSLVHQSILVFRK